MKFRTTILTAIVLVIAGILAPVGLLVRDLLEEDATTNLAERLERTTVVFEDLQAYRQEQLRAQVKVTAEEPRVKAVVATDEIEHETVLDVAHELVRAIGSDLFIMTDGEGMLLADTADPEAFGHDLTGMPLVARSLAEGQASGIWTDDEGIFQMQAQRIAFGETVVGNLVVGYRVDDEFAATVFRHTGSSTAIIVDGQPIAVATDELGAGEPLLATATLPASNELEEFDVDGHRFIGLVRPLPGYDGERDVRYVVYRSLDSALAASHEIGEVLYMVGLAGFGLAVVIALWIAWRLSRPLDRLVEFTRAISSGDLASRATPSGPTEIRALGRAMNEMAEQVRRSKQEVEDINQGLERTVAERIAEIREMLDNLTDGLFIVDATGAVCGPCSPTCAEIFGRDVMKADVRELLFGDGCTDETEALATHRFVLDTTFGEPDWQWEANEPHLLSSVSYARPDGQVRRLELAYAPLFNDEGDLERLMVIASDVTEVLALRHQVEEEQARNKERVGALLELLQSPRSEVLGFIDDNEVRMERVRQSVSAWRDAPSRERLDGIFRELHTIKGNARMLKLARVSAHTHEVEDVVHRLIARQESEGHGDAADELHAAIAGLDALLGAYRAVADETLRAGDATGWQDKAAVAARRLDDAAAAVESGGAAPGPALRAMADLMVAEANEEVVSINALFSQHRTLVHDIAGRLGKLVPFDDCVDPARDLFVVTPVARLIRDAVNHAIRNSLDHGIETPEERVEAGKPAEGRIWSRCSVRDGDFVVTIEDDGRGVDFDALLEAGRARGFVEADERPGREALLELLFAPGFSTRSVVTDVSGRGVGLDAVRESAVALEGTVRMHSTDGRGTCLEITIPKAAAEFLLSEGRIEKVAAAQDVRAA